MQINRDPRNSGAFRQLAILALRTPPVNATKDECSLHLPNA